MGSLLSISSEFFPGKPRFSEADTPDLSGKVVIVTGGNSGVGKVTARALLAHNAKVYIAARSPSKVETAIQELKAATGKNSVHFLKLDLADLKSVKAAAEEFSSKESQLHFLYNNAGVMACPVDQITAQGYDLQFGVNVLGHFYFTQLLLPILTSTAQASPPGTVRIVNTSSLVHWYGKLDFATFKDGPKRRKVDTQMLYAQSKIGNAIYSMEFARRYADKGIITSVINPGNLKTELQREFRGLHAKMVDLLLYDVNTYGALSPLYVGVSQEGAELNGQYIMPWARIGRGKDIIRNPKIGRDLWNWLEEQVAQAGL
ncbi:hypothetical protein PLICRDRAFT_107316 [Plicaturopsis crispa FD-325 SS-3]|nr:hypothetical protein PLICRDRAFT_107316 [Plicaturopsis crispa FD-325 SS-3]